MKSINRFFYGPTPEERVREWRQKLRGEERKLDREIRNLDLATSKSRSELKQLAKRNDVKSARILAKEIVRSNKQRDRLVSSKARLNSVQMQLQHQLSMVKVTGAFQKSTEIMKSTNALVKLPQLNATMRQMSMEMMKSGIMEEMMEETMEGLDDEELEEEADEEVDKVLFELTDGKLGQAGRVGGELPVSVPIVDRHPSIGYFKLCKDRLELTHQAEAEDEAENEAEMARMQREMQDLLSG